MTTLLMPPRRSADARSADALVADAPDASAIASAFASTDALASDPRYQAIVARDRSWDGAFVFGVTSTGIYCRPSCPSRRARADRVRFFGDIADAQRAGFRACKRCAPDAMPAADDLHTGVTRALAQLDASDDPVSLDTLAVTAGVSRAHFQRQFVRLVGCSPHEWQTARRAERLRSALAKGASVSSAAFGAGFESLPSAYTAANQHLGMKPGALRKGAPGERLFYTVVPSALGLVLVAMSQRGVCRVILGDDREQLVRQFAQEMHAATLVADDPMVQETAASIVAVASGKALAHALPLDLRGTAFQQRVWKELTRIPHGETVTYGELARRIGAPGATRAVGTACGANPVAMVVPCHRVLRGDGALGGYRWGVERKERLLHAERDGVGGNREEGDSGEGDSA